jgi:hypothetical protein
VPVPLQLERATRRPAPPSLAVRAEDLRARARRQQPEHLLPAELRVPRELRPGPRVLQPGPRVRAAVAQPCRVRPASSPPAT